MKILGVAGSLRAGSYNMAVLKAACQLVPGGTSQENNLPKAVKKFKDKIKSSDAILFSIPEYNFSIPGVLKRAI